MDIQIRLFVYLLFFVKWKCLNFYLVPSFEFSHIKQLTWVILIVYHLYFSTNFLLFPKCSLIFMNIQIRYCVYLIILVKMQCLNFKSCREEIARALKEFCNRWCKREHVESNALNSLKLNIFKIIDGSISFYCNN